MISVVHFLLAGGGATVLGLVQDFGAFEGRAGATLTLGEALAGGGIGDGVLDLKGPAVLSGLNVVGATGSSAAQQLIVSGAASVSGLTLGGSAALYDRGSVTQAGGNVSFDDAGVEYQGSLDVGLVDRT